MPDATASSTASEEGAPTDARAVFEEPLPEDLETVLTALRDA